MERTFPVLWQGSRQHLKELEALECMRSIPWSLIAPHEKQALKNHDQTLERLAQRGGLDPKEMVAVLTNHCYQEVMSLTYAEAVTMLKQFAEQANGRTL